MSKKLFYSFRMLVSPVVLLALLLAMVTWGAISHAVAAGDWYVNPGESIQTAIDAAYSAGGGTVHVAAGTYYELITLKSGVSVQGDGAILTIINGDTDSDGIGDGSVVSALNVDSTAGLGGFTITNGTGTPDGWGHMCGGGMYNVNSSPTLTNCTFAQNRVGYQGGGMYNSGGSPALTNCTLSGNSAGPVGPNDPAGSGGGMYNSGGSPTLVDCTFSGNNSGLYEAGTGGGMCNDSSSPTLTNCAFISNVTFGAGGGICNFSSSPTLTNCTFSGNEGRDMAWGGGMYNGNSSSPAVTNCTFSVNDAGAGGGMCNNSSSPTLTNCTFSGNLVYAGSGGGIHNSSSSPTLTNCLFSGNGGSGMSNIVSSHPSVINCTFSGNLSGGMVNDEMCDPTITNCTFSGNLDYGIFNNDSSRPTLTNCILWGDDGEEISNEQGSSPVVNYCDVMGGYSGTGNLNLDPLLTADLHLQLGSPCIDAGTDSAPSLPATDFDGDNRILDGDNDGTATVDMGADEYLAPQPVSATIDFDPDTLNLRSKGKYVGAHVELPVGYDVAEIDIASIRLEGTVPALAKPIAMGDYDDDGVPDLMLKFDKAAVLGMLSVGDQVQLTISGMAAGIDFEGTDTIKVRG